MTKARNQPNGQFDGDCVIVATKGDEITKAMAFGGWRGLANSGTAIIRDYANADEIYYWTFFPSRHLPRTSVSAPLPYFACDAKGGW